MADPERLYRAGRRIADGLAIAVVVVALGAVVLARAVPALGHPVYVVAGPSMAPAIEMGAAVVLESVRPEALRVGDVVSLKSGPEQAIFTHRIVRLAPHDGTIWIETRGDGNPAPDPSLTPATAVIGRVTATIPYAGYVIALLSVPSGVVFVIAVGLLLLTLGWWFEGLELDRRRLRRTLAGGVAAPPPPAARTTAAASERATRIRERRAIRTATGRRPG
jgi:signal peptidase I